MAYNFYKVNKCVPNDRGYDRENSKKLQRMMQDDRGDWQQKNLIKM